MNKDRNGELNFVTGNSGTYKSRFIAKFFCNGKSHNVDEFYLFTHKHNFDFNYEYVTDTFYETEDLLVLLKLLKQNPRPDKKKLLVIDDLRFGTRPSANTDLDYLVDFLYKDLKKFNTVIVIGTLLLYGFKNFNIYDQIDNIYLSSECFNLNIKNYHKLTKNTIGIKEFSKLISFVENNKFLSIQNIQSPNITIRKIKFNININESNKPYTIVNQTNIYNKKKFKSELHLVLGSEQYDKSFFGIKYIYEKIKDNFDKVFVLTNNTNYYKSEFLNQDIYTVEKYFLHNKYNVFESKLKYKLVTNLKDDILNSQRQFINNFLIIDLDNIDSILDILNNSDKYDNVSDKSIDSKKINNNKNTSKMNSESDLKSDINPSNICTNESIDESYESKNKTIKKIIIFLLKNRYSFNITIVIMTRKYINVDFTHLYMGIEKNKDILVSNYNNFEFKKKFGLKLFNTVNDELVQGKFLFKQFDDPNTNVLTDTIKVVSIQYQKKLIKPKVHILLANKGDKQICFIKKKLVSKITKYITNTWILAPKENQHYWWEPEEHFFTINTIEKLISNIKLSTNINQLLIIDYGHNINKKIIENNNFTNLLKNYFQYKLTIIWSIQSFDDIKLNIYWNCLHDIHFDYVYLDNISLISKIKSTYKSLNTNLFDFDFYKIINKHYNLDNKYIMIKYKNNSYGSYFLDYIDIVNVV